MPMFTEDPVAQTTRHVAAAASMATDLSWLLCGAAKQSMRDRYPQLAVIFSGREDLSERVRTFWGDGAEEVGFTEMHILSHYAGALYETQPDAVWSALEEGVAVVPL